MPSRTSKGVVCAPLSTRSSVTNSSTSPVGILSVFASRSRSVPAAITTYSLFRPEAFSNTARSVESSKISCRMPVVSRRSAKITPPLSRHFAMEPATVICVPASLARSVPQ